MHPKRTISGYFFLSPYKFSREFYSKNESFRCIWDIRLPDILFFLSSEHDDEFYFQMNPFDASETCNFQIFLFSHFLNTFFRCNWNLEHSFVPILKTCRWIFSSILESFNLKRTFSIHLKHTTSGYSFLPIFWITMMFYSQTNPYSFDTFETYDFRIYSFFPILRTMTNIFLALSRILISNESTFFRCIFFQKIFSSHLPRIFFLAPSNQTHISIHLSLESGRQPAKLSVVAVSTSRNASCLS